MNSVEDKIRDLCARLLAAAPNSSEFANYRSQLKSAAAELATQAKNWKKASERDKHQDEARQSYRSRENDSADEFAHRLNLFSPKKHDFEKKKTR